MSNLLVVFEITHLTCVEFTISTVLICEDITSFIHILIDFFQTYDNAHNQVHNNQSAAIDFHVS